jgi:hypothetical protein
VFRPALFVLLACVLCWQAQAAGKPASDDSGKPAAQKQDDAITYNYAVLRLLNKVTARTETMEVPVGTVARFGNLEIVVLSCAASPPDQHPDDAVLMDVRELRPGESPRRVFVGWMFSASPSISSIEHPVYDITVIKCHQQSLEEGDETSDEEDKPSAKPAKPKP